MERNTDDVDTEEFAAADREQALRALLEHKIWPSLPVDARGRAPSAREQDEILGYDSLGS